MGINNKITHVNAELIPQDNSADNDDKAVSRRRALEAGAAALALLMMPKLAFGATCPGGNPPDEKGWFGSENGSVVHHGGKYIGVGGGALLTGPILDTTPRHISISGTMVFKTPISALEFMFITSCPEALITGLHLTGFFLMDLQVPLIPSWAVIFTQKSIKLPSTRTCLCSAGSSRSFRMLLRADINVWMSLMPARHR